MADENEFNLFLTRWNASTAPKPKKPFHGYRKPISQAQRDAAEAAVEARRRRMSY